MADPNGAKVGAGRPAAIYAREPTLSEHERLPVEGQLDACRALAERLGYSVADEATFADAGPNTTMGRPGLTALLGLIAQRRVSAVITHTLDRLARPESKALEALLKELERRDMPIYVAKIPRGYSYDSGTGKLVVDPEAVAEANREEWRPPEYIPIPREDPLQ
jgi:hypothetical protein